MGRRPLSVLPAATSKRVAPKVTPLKALTVTAC